MKSSMQSMFRNILSAAVLTLALLNSPRATAQAVSAASPPQRAQANPLPLSGRTAQTGSVTATQLPIAGATTSVNTINPAVQVQGPYAGSATESPNAPPSGKLSLREAVQRGLQYNLGAVDQMQAVIQARGQSRVTRSALLPNLNAYSSESVEQINLLALGLGSGAIAPAVSIPPIVGPFNVFDLRVTLSQSILDRTAFNNYRSSAETVHANRMWAQDARDLVILAVGGAYLQVIAAQAKVQSARAQLQTAEALYQQAVDQKNAGIVAKTDVNRSQIEALTQRQRLVSLENEVSRQKINLARMTGLSLSGPLDLSDDIPFAPAPPMSLETALQLAFEQRADLQAAQAEVRAAERSLAAARSERLPTLAVRADYGVIGPRPAQSHSTFAVVGRVDIPIWNGDRITGAIETAEAVLGQREAERQDIRAQIESDVRNAYLNLEAAGSQVEVAQTNIGVTRENLDLTRQRFAEGVSDNVEVIQSQEAVASAQSDYINSVFAHNLAKLALLRATGSGVDRLPQFVAIH